MIDYGAGNLGCEWDPADAFIGQEDLDRWSDILRKDPKKIADVAFEAPPRLIAEVERLSKRAVEYQDLWMAERDKVMRYAMAVGPIAALETKS